MAEARKYSQYKVKYREGRSGAANMRVSHRLKSFTACVIAVLLPLINNYELSLN